MKKIGIMGAGQAGTRIAVALQEFKDVKVTGIVDPKPSIDILKQQNSRWHINTAKFFKDDDAMLQEEYDGIVVAADPISMALRKPVVFQRNNIDVPILWERPFGFESKHPISIEKIVPSNNQKIMSFARYGLSEKILTDVKTKVGKFIDFDIFITLNCGLDKKDWRQNNKVPMPVHLLDTAFEQIERFGEGKIKNIRAISSSTQNQQIIYDEKWTVNIEMESGLTGRVGGLQYTGDLEYLYPLRQTRIIGSEGSFISVLGDTFIISNGEKIKIDINDYITDNRIISSISKLESFFKDIDGYPNTTLCKGEALALSECLRTWIDNISGKEGKKSIPLCSCADSIRTLTVAEACIESNLNNGSSVQVI